MNNVLSSLIAGALGAASALVVGEVPDSPPSVVLLLIACIGGGITLGSAIGECLERVHASRKVRDLAGELMSWRDVCFVGGVVLGLVGFALIVLIALI